jgi:DNA-binding response OmpR family regulator
MYDRPVEILLVEPDTDLADMIRECLPASSQVNVTVAADAASALREELTAAHDVLLVATDLPDAPWTDLVREIRQTNRGPLILLAQAPSAMDMLEAVRARVTDVLIKPFDLAELCTLTDQAARLAFKRGRARLRHRRLRRLTARIICERRDLRQRIDLICRDFVHAYRRLAQRVSDADLISHQ